MYKIWTRNDPKSMKESFDYSNFNTNKFKTNPRMELIVNRLIDDGYTLNKVNINGIHSIALYKKHIVNEFRTTPPWSEIPYGAYNTVNLHTDVFIIISEINKISKKSIVDFSDYSCGYSIKNKKFKLRGMKTGIISIAILMSNDIDNEAVKWVNSSPPRHFAALEVPVIYDLTDGHFYYFNDKEFRGSMIRPYAYRLIDQLLQNL